jgi:dihydrofolate reductase
MRKLIVSIHSTANDIVTGPPSDADNFMVWAQAGIEDSLDHVLKSFANVDTILLGRVTYEGLEKAWPKVKEWPDASQTTLRIGEKMNTIPKLVVTGKHPRKELPWGTFEPATAITGDDVEAQIKALKQRAGGEIITFGSPTLVQSLTNAGLVDEYRILIHPVVMDRGKRLFADLRGRTDLKLIGVDPLARGAMWVTYAVA